METQKVVNLLNGSDNENTKFATKKWYVNDSESNDNYSKDDPIKLSTKYIESNLCDQSDAYILVTENITVTRTIAVAGDNPVQRKQELTAATKVVFKNCTTFNECRTEINGTLLTKQILLILQCLSTISLSIVTIFKRDEIADNADVTNDDNALSFKNRANITDNTETN